MTPPALPKPPWPHSPLHRFNERGFYIITGATLHKQHFFKNPEDLDLLQSHIIELAEKYGCQLQAWAVFSNHYHLILSTPKDPSTIRKLISHLHSASARSLNKKQDVKGRKVWFQYWDTHLTFQNSYFARLNYVMKNPVKHGLVDDARDYPWCSASWFEKHATKSQCISIANFKTDTVQVIDNF